MYQDPTKIRQHVVKIRLSDEEANLIQSLVDYTGEQKAALLRELILEQAVSVLHGDKSMPVDDAVRAPVSALIEAA